jgi:hypothetical protein
MQVSTGKIDSTVLGFEANILSRPERGTDQATTLAAWLRISYFLNLNGDHGLFCLQYSRPMM